MQRLNITIIFIILNCLFATCLSHTLKIHIMNQSKLFQQDGIYKTTILFIDNNYNQIKQQSFFSTNVQQTVHANISGIEQKKLSHIEVVVCPLFPQQASKELNPKKRHSYQPAKPFRFRTYSSEEGSPLIINLTNAIAILQQNHSYLILNNSIAKKYENIISNIKTNTILYS